jgi:hypothetical protein
VGKDRWAWEIRFVFTPRMVMIGLGWDEPGGAPWEPRSLSLHLLCFAATVQRPVRTVDPQEVVDWLAAHAGQ